jgi:hypothetical protein
MQVELGCASPPCHHRLLAAACAEVSYAEVLCDHAVYISCRQVELGCLRAFLRWWPTGHGSVVELVIIGEYAWHVEKADQQACGGQAVGGEHI